MNFLLSMLFYGYAYYLLDHAGISMINQLAIVYCCIIGATVNVKK